jgi:hypothetical protein
MSLLTTTPFAMIVLSVNAVSGFAALLSGAKAVRGPRIEGFYPVKKEVTR